MSHTVLVITVHGWKGLIGNVHINNSKSPYGMFFFFFFFSGLLNGFRQRADKSNHRSVLVPPRVSTRPLVLGAISSLRWLQRSCFKNQTILFSLANCLDRSKPWTWSSMMMRTLSKPSLRRIILALPCGLPSRMLPSPGVSNWRVSWTLTRPFGPDVAFTLTRNLLPSNLWKCN